MDMKRTALIAATIALAVSASCSNDLEVSSPRVADGLLDLCDSVSIGLDYATSERVILPSPEGYSNNVLLTGFKGEYYCMWQHSTRDEDSPDTHVLLSTSADARNWSAPEILIRGDGDFFTSPGGWIQRGDSLCAVINRIRSGGRKGGEAWYVTTHGDGVWSTPRRLQMAGGEPLDGIFEQDPLVLPTGRTIGAAHFGETLDVCPLFTDDPSGLAGWRKALLPSGEGKPLEPSRYVSGDGSLVMLFRDQESSFRKLFSISRDCGESWSAPMMTDIPDSRSKQCAGNLPDGRAFMVWNPSASKSRRHLAIAVSGDGLLFDRAWLIAGPRELPPQRREGRYKTIGYNYPKATVIDGVLWVSLSVNKEDVTLFRIAPEDLLRDYHTEKPI